MVQPLRIFISSPDDVVGERRRTALVIQRLKREFARFFDLSAVLWEYEPMLASGHFQDIIEQPSTTDVVVMILWSRLGTSLPADRYHGLDGRVPVTGTEWEFENALTGRAQRGTPDILVYRKTAEAVARFSHQQQLEAARIQWDALQRFWERHFEADGAFKTAFNTFEDLDGFEAMLENHLRAMLRRRLPERATNNGPQSITWHDGSPFRGLEAFEPRHAAVFFGRDRAEREVTEALVRAAEADCAFLMVTGASGSGKSSLVTAGVLANLMAPGVVAGVDTWRYVLFRPGQAPANLCGGLARAVIEQLTGLPELPMAGVSLAKLTDQFNDAPEHAGLPIGVGLTRAGVSETAGKLVLIVDQLEELFTLAEITDEARSAFIRLLGGLARSGLVWVLATLRSDYLHRFTDAPALRDLASGERLYHLLPPRPAEIELLVRLPAEAAGLAFETEGNDGTELGAVIVEAGGRHPGALPLLSFVLDDLYRRDVRQGGALLTFESYRAMGGLEGSIATRAEEVAAELIRPLPKVMEAALASVLRALVTVAEDGTATARVVARDEIAMVPERAAVLDSLIAARLVVAAGDGREASVRLAHEALLEHWPRFHNLVAEDGEFLRARGRLVADRARWEVDGCPDDLLLPGGKRLVDAEDLLARRHDELDGETIAFVKASVRRDRTMRDRALRRARGAAAAMTVLAALAGTLGWIAWDNSIEAKNRTADANRLSKIAQTRSIEAEKQTQLAQTSAAEAQAQLAASQVAQSQFLARESLTAHDSGAERTALVIALAALPRDLRPNKRERPLVPEAEAVLRAALFGDRLRGAFVGHLGTITSGAFSPDGTRFVTASDDGTARVWDVRTGSELSIFQRHRLDAGSRQPSFMWEVKRKITSVSFSPDGTRVATGSLDSTVRVWDAQTGSQIIVMDADDSMVVNSVSFSPDGSRILAASKNAARVWDARTGAEVSALAGLDGDVRSASFSSDGHRIVTTFGHTAQVWDAQSGTVIAIFDKHSGAITSASFSRDGSRVVTGSEDNSARVWDAQTGAEIAAFKTHTGPVTAASFSPDGGRVVTASTDHTARVWDAQTGAEIAPLTGHGDDVLSASFSPDGIRVVTASKDGATVLWDVQTGFPIAVLPDKTGMPIFALFSPDGTRVVTAYQNGTALLWDAGPGPVAAVLKGHRAGLLSASFSSDGNRIVTAAEDGSAKVWDARSGAEVTALLGHGDAVRSVSFSPNGTQVVTASEDGTARIWNSRTGALIFELKNYKGKVWSASFSPDGRLVVTASQESVATIWDAGSGAEIVTLKGHRGVVNSASFNRDGSRVVTASDDGTARLWDPVTGTEVAMLRAGPAQYALASFSPDGAKVVTTDGDDVARIWDAQSGRELVALKGRGAVASAASFSSDGTRVVAVSYSSTSGVWDAETGAKIVSLEGHRDQLISSSFSRDGTRVLTASRDGTAQLRDARTGITVAKLSLHQGPIWSAEFNPKGTQVVTASQDGTARVWNVGEAEDPVALGNMVAMRALSLSERRTLYLEGITTPERQIGTEPCDALAGDPYDPQHIGRGVVTDAIDTVRAIPVCQEAVEKAPNQPRLRYQLWRALQKSGQGETAKAELNSLAAAGYPAAIAVQAVLEGTGPSPDWADIIDRYRKALDQGVIFTASNLGWMAWSGLGQPENRDEAVKWWQTGADLGDPFSHAHLAELYERGDQIPQDLRQALLHHAVAARLFAEVGDAENAEFQAARRGTLARALPADQVAPLWYQVLDWQPRQHH